jgi:predicted Holliday junction resolvase-like endonuclease
MLENKRGQVGETITWVISTIILIVILIVFVFASVELSKVKSLKVNLKANSEESADWINSKTQMAYSISSTNRNRISSWISEEEVENE